LMPKDQSPLNEGPAPPMDSRLWGSPNGKILKRYCSSIIFISLININCHRHSPSILNVTYVYRCYILFINEEMQYTSLTP